MKLKIISTEYGLNTWPSAIVLAHYIWHNKKDFNKKNVLEIGCGTSLPGIVSACCGSSVILTDEEDSHDILNNAKINWVMNNPVNYVRKGVKENIFLDIKVIGFTWGRFNLDIRSIENPDIIIGADCFYDNSEVFEDIISTLEYFFQRNKNIRFLTTYHERSSHRTILFLLKKWNFKAKSIDIKSLPLEKYNFKNTIHLIEIYKET